MYVIYATVTLAVNFSDTLKQLIRICAELFMFITFLGNTS